ncbi:hypothetical protein G6M89_15825 [Natronolimnobius sp. AArcel1]|uniref:asparagine synthase-related protein n=1 Tax=Natronolimnobius sp. AArcel1 TaxID=1679093 RepID=UPI0013EDD48B|nr:asparagine synthase-related protein [Natronolimnobius sp. AArcel1]NGM70451.1 hypothetical protein [Natronolimnobius sp. AArcel1]
MHRELFGVFGDREQFDRVRSTDAFDVVCSGPRLTVGLRDDDLGAPGWSAQYSDDKCCCVVWGELYVPESNSDDPVNSAEWLVDQYERRGHGVLRDLNGSYLVVLDHEEVAEAFVATDPVRSRECFYTDDPGTRVFGTDAAAVGQTVPDPTPDRTGVLEYLHLGVILGEKTALEGLHRLPIDSRLELSGYTPLDRFVYQPEPFDYVDELATRLERALRRRSRLPGKKGVLLSAGYDSRIILSQVDQIDHAYTVGSPDAQEVRGAKRLAAQYGAAHTAFPPDERYLRPDDTKIRYSQGIKESLHIHHAGYTDDIGVDTMYHGLLCDTFFRGHFTARETVDVLDKRIPVGGLESDPNPIDTLLEKFGYSQAASLELADRTAFDESPESFVRAAVGDAFDACQSRAGDVQNTLTCCGIANQPSIPFHAQLSDHFITSFLATDRELIDWHLRTPPAHRTTATFLEACEQVDDSILRHRPPDRPHDVALLNEIEGFVRRKTPFLPSFEPPWPNREHLFETHDFDQRLLDDLESAHPLPARHKLRITDLRGWFDPWAETDPTLQRWLQPIQSINP